MTVADKFEGVGLILLGTAAVLMIVSAMMTPWDDRAPTPPHVSMMRRAAAVLFGVAVTCCVASVVAS